MAATIKNYFVPIAVVIIVSLYAASATSAELYGLVFLLWSLILMIFLGIRNRPLAAALIMGFVLRAGLALVDYYIFPLPAAASDAQRFERIGWEWSGYGFPLLFEYFGTGSRMYTWTIAVIYALTDRSPLLIQGVNVLIGSLVIYNVYKTSLLLWNTSAAVRAAWITALFPNLLLWTPVILREAPVMFTLSLGIMFFVQWHVTKRSPYVVLSFISFGLCAAYHDGMVVIMFLFPIIIVWRWLQAFLHNYGTSLIQYTAGIIFLVGTIILFGGLNLSFKTMDDVAIDNIELRQERAARDRAAYLTGLTVRSPVDVVWQGPIRLVFFTFTPFIWMVRNINDIVGFTDALLMIFIAVSIHRSRHYILKNATAKVLLLFLLGLLFVFSLYVSNYGTAMRHRAKMVPIAISLMVIAPYDRRRNEEIIAGLNGDGNDNPRR